MEKRFTKRKKLLVLLVVAVAAVVVVSVVLYSLFGVASNSFQLNVPENNVVQNLGSQYPGMIDVVSALLGVNGTRLTVTFNLRGPVSYVSSSEDAQWNVTLELWNDTDVLNPNAGVLKTYEVVVNLNSTQITGQIEDVDNQTVQDCQVSYNKNILTVQAVVAELPATKLIQWGIVTNYEQYDSGGNLIASATDVAPDEGLQETVLS
jgi:hypothetical protein